MYSTRVTIDGRTAEAESGEGQNPGEFYYVLRVVYYDEGTDGVRRAALYAYPWHGHTMATVQEWADCIVGAGDPRAEILSILTGKGADNGQS